MKKKIIFFYNSKKIDINKNRTVADLGIMDGQTIQVIKNNNINLENKNSYLSEDSNSSSESFEDETNKQFNNLNSEQFLKISFNAQKGLKLVLSINKNETVSYLLKSFAKKIGIDENLVGEHLIFIYKTTMLSLGDIRKVKDVFSGEMDTIDVIEQGPIIGA